MVDVSQLKGLTQDSRKVKPGWLFAALPGVKVDGCDFIGDAIAQGASVILAPDGTTVEGDVELITDANPRWAFAKLAAEFYGAQPETIVAVTGTNGKTSVVTFAEQLWAAAGKKASSLGTLKGNMTTPDPVALHEKLAELAGGGVTHLAMEASSHGLDQCRLDGVKLQAAGFTNLSQDHLDYHSTMDAYFAAKARLFAELLPEGGAAVLNADDARFAALKDMCEARGLRVISYGAAGQDLKVLSATPEETGQAVELEIFGQRAAFTLPLVGGFQLMNALCALGLVLANDPENQSVYVEALASLKGAAGRLQSIAGHPQGAGVYVDYAHTPDALENILKALRPHTSGKLTCVFGCGGDRDKAKRPLMGAVVRELADAAIVTDDNPRSEDPADIRRAILEAIPGALEIGDRRAAIARGLKDLGPGDVLVIAGKGHEQGQIFADRVDPFDDVLEAQSAINSLNSPNSLQ